jgi:hypothetical protein
VRQAAVYQPADARGIEVTISGGAVRYTHVVRLRNAAVEATAEQGTGTIDGQKINLQGSWKSGSRQYEAKYSGSFVRRSAKLKGTQTWTDGGKTATVPAQARSSGRSSHSCRAARSRRLRGEIVARIEAEGAIRRLPATNYPAIRHRPCDNFMNSRLHRNRGLRFRPNALHPQFSFLPRRVSF